MPKTQQKRKNTQRQIKPKDSDIVKKRVKKFFDEEAEEGDESENEIKAVKDCEVYTKEFL